MDITFINLREKDIEILGEKRFLKFEKDEKNVLAGYINLRKNDIEILKGKETRIFLIFLSNKNDF